MRKIEMEKPVAHTSGSLDNRVSNGRKNVTRYAKIGEDQHGRPIYKQEMYEYHLCEHKWPEGAQRNRQLFQAAQRQARAELNDPERRVYWENQYAEHRRTYRQGERLYVRLLGFVCARIHAELKQGSAI